jgi:hypothetical protein
MVDSFFGFIKLFGYRVMYKKQTTTPQQRLHPVCTFFYTANTISVACESTNTPQMQMQQDMPNILPKKKMNAKK